MTADTGELIYALQVLIELWNAVIPLDLKPIYLVSSNVARNFGTGLLARATNADKQRVRARRPDNPGNPENVLDAAVEQDQVKLCIILVDQVLVVLLLVAQYPLLHSLLIVHHLVDLRDDIIDIHVFWDLIRRIPHEIGEVDVLVIVLTLLYIVLNFVPQRLTELIVR